MVQRKVPNKVGIQDDHDKPEKGLVKLKPSASNQQDHKNRGADLKKKMKKSRSIKRPGFESLRSSQPSKQEIPQPGKPPPRPDHVPKRQSPTKAAETSPNYMKSTSSFEARKERSQVSPSRTSQVSNISNKSPSPSPKKSSNSRNSSVSGHKSVGTTLTRTSSLKKLVRTLTKTPSFKPARASVKKYSPVVLCENIDVQKPTCSSTLKDSKFPNYLTLSPGATESEGTSAMKVCPYTYCSLNGHHHAPVPPLKGFLSAKRRALKAQKSIKLGCLSPRRAKPSPDLIHTEKPLIEGIDLDSSPLTPPMQENQTDFFIEIYSNNGNNIYGRKILEGLSGKPKCSDIDFEEDLEGKEANPPSMEHNSEEESQARSQIGQSDSEVCGMDWEAGHYYEPSLHDEPIFKLKEIDLCESDDDISGFDDVLADRVLVGLYDEESMWSDAWIDDGASELDGSYQNMESDNSIVACYEYAASAELTTTDEIDGNCESNQALGKEITCSPVEDLVEELKATTEDNNRIQEASNEISKLDLQLGVDDETKCISDVVEETVTENQENESALDEYVGEHSDSVHDSTEQYQNETFDECCASRKGIAAYQFDSTTKANLPAETEDAEADQEEDIEQEIRTSDANDIIDGEEQLHAAKSFGEIQTFELLQEFSEPNQMKFDEDNDESKLDDVTGEIETSQSLVDGENQDSSEINLNGAKNPKIINSVYSEDETESEATRLRSTENKDQEVATIEGKHPSNLDAEEISSTVEDASNTKTRDKVPFVRKNSNEEIPQSCTNPSWTITRKTREEELEESRDFNPREPNYLPVEPDPEAEKVDLRHQMMDERKNAEEWMVDYALQQAVTKLAPARKRKVALLVEAFEKVLPSPKYEAHMGPTSGAFVHSRTVPACG